MLLAGDAAHTVPCTGAKGLNLALRDVAIMAEVIQQAVTAHDMSRLDACGPRALQRVRRSEHFSY